MGFSDSESEDDAPNNQQESSQSNSNRLADLKKLRQKDTMRDFRHESSELGGSRKRGHDAETLSDDEDEEPADKKQKTAAERMMERMGYKEGSGLGKNKQGIAEPIQLNTQRGRTGIGHEGGKALARDLNEDWDDSTETKTVEETPFWHPSFEDEDRDEDDELKYKERQQEVDRVLQSTVTVAKKKLNIDDEIDVVDRETLRKLLDAKNVFDHLNDRELREARARANPYETIASGIFQNRAAMKAANMDRVFDFCFSQEDPNDLEVKCPLDINKSGSNKKHRDHELFYFADVCAGPGGFSEYQLWRKGFYNAKGFGFTLKGKDDFKLTKFLASSPLCFEPYYGVKDNGDVTIPENIESLQKLVMTGTDGVGVHLMMADGGFSVEGQENIQEILSKRIYLCQLLVSLCIVRDGGNFYCKLFDVFTRFSYELVFLMRLCYREVCIHKPHTSRPANSERYIVCKGLIRRFSDPIRDYLKKVNEKMQTLSSKDSEDDVMQLLPNHFGNTLTECEKTYLEYITDSNNMIARRQIHYLNKYRIYAKNAGLIDKDQGDLREKCMQYWRVPYDMHPNNDRRRQGAQRQRENFSPEMLLAKYAPRVYGDSDFHARPFEFEKEWKKFFFDAQKPKQLVHEEYRCMWATEDKPSQSRVKLPKLLVSTPDAVYIYEDHWTKCEHFQYRVPGHSIMLVELTNAMLKDDHGKLGFPRGGDPTLIRILDAGVLAGDDISGLKYDDRMKCVEKLCKAVNLVENCVFVAVPQLSGGYNNRRGGDNRPKFDRRRFYPLVLTPAETFTFDHLSENLPRMMVFQKEEIVVTEEGGRTFKCSGMHVFKYLVDGWSMFFARGAQQCYAFAPKAGSVFSDQFESKGCVTSFWDTSILKKRHYRLFWNWRNTYADHLYGPNAILSSHSNEGGPTVKEIEKRVEEMREQALGLEGAEKSESVLGTR